MYHIGSRENEVRGFVLYNADVENEMRQLKKEEFKSGARKDLGAAGNVEILYMPNWSAGLDIPFYINGS